MNLMTWYFLEKRGFVAPTRVLILDPRAVGSTTGSKGFPHTPYKKGSCSYMRVGLRVGRR